MAMSDILSIFQAKQPASQAVNQNPTIPNENTPKADGTGPVAIPKQGEGEKAPLAEYAKLWENDPTKQPEAPQPFFNADPKKLLEAARTIDFSKQIPAEVLAKVAAGGEGAQAAFSEAINAVTQAAYAQSAHATTKIVEAALTKQMEQVMAKIPDLVRNQAIKENLRAENPLFSNPAVSPMLSMLESQISSKNPTASAAEVNTMAKNFLNEFATAIGVQQTASQNNQNNNASGNMKKTGAKGDNWEDFFGVSSSAS